MGDEVVDDPLALRAIAHPLRLAILNYLRTVESATASECAAALGGVPSACSFHLRVLHRFGLIEEDLEAPTHGRRRPWRACHVRLGIESHESSADTGEVIGAWQAIRSDVEDARRRAIERDTEYPPEWRRATGGDHLRLNLSAEELMRLRWAIDSLCRGAAARASAERSGAQPVDVVIDYVPRFSPDQASG